MSNTYKTKPLAVLMANRKEGRRIIGTEASHDHANGNVCDLPERPDPKTRRGGTRCYWDFTYKGKNLCGCDLCTQQTARRMERRSDRHRQNANMNALRKRITNSDLNNEDNIFDALDQDVDRRAKR